MSSPTIENIIGGSTAEKITPNSTTLDHRVALGFEF